jgi:hypothetical protein
MGWAWRTGPTGRGIAGIYSDLHLGRVDIFKEHASGKVVQKGYLALKRLGCVDGYEKLCLCHRSEIHDAWFLSCALLKAVQTVPTPSDVLQRTSPLADVKDVLNGKISAHLR